MNLQHGAKLIDEYLDAAKSPVAIRLHVPSYLHAEYIKRVIAAGFLRDAGSLPINSLLLLRK